MDPNYERTIRDLAASLRIRGTKELPPGEFDCDDLVDELLMDGFGSGTICMLAVEELAKPAWSTPLESPRNRRRFRVKDI